jgi:hypothetical protein
MLNSHASFLARHNQQHSFHKTMFRVTSAFIALVFVAIVVIMGLVLSGKMPGYHYEVTESYGNMTRHYEVGYGDDDSNFDSGMGGYGYRR